MAVYSRYLDKEFILDLATRFPRAYSKFALRLDPKVDFIGNCMTYFADSDLIVDCHQFKFPSKYAGTWCVTITIAKRGLVLALKRKRSRISYPHHSSYDHAISKGITKAFEIIECIICKRPLPEKARKMRPRK